MLKKIVLTFLVIHALQATSLRPNGQHYEPEVRQNAQPMSVGRSARAVVVGRIVSTLRPIAVIGCTVVIGVGNEKETIDSIDNPHPELLAMLCKVNQG